LAFDVICDGCFDIEKADVFQKQGCRVFGIERRDDTIWRVCNDGIGQNERANTLTGALGAASLIQVSFMFDQDMMFGIPKHTPPTMVKPFVQDSMT
jgi:hypothetical protein